jgi:hypothetical protein
VLLSARHDLNPKRAHSFGTLPKSTSSSYFSRHPRHVDVRFDPESDHDRAALQYVATGQQPTSLARWTWSIHFTKSHSFHVGEEAVALRQLQQVLFLRPVR